MPQKRYLVFGVWWRRPAAAGRTLDVGEEEEEEEVSLLVFVLWRSADGKHHLQTGNLRYLLGLIAKCRQEQEAEATDSIIEVI